MSYKTKLFKSVVCSKPDKNLFSKLSESGIQGIELHATDLTVEKARELRNAAEEANLRIHAYKIEADLCVAANRSASIAKISTALSVASALGCGTLLLAPGRIGGMEMPKPWEFCIAYNPKTGYVKSVDEKNSEQYKPYIEAHNTACDNITAALFEMKPLIVKSGIIVTLQHSWNNINVLPELMTAFIDSLDSHYIKTDFDMGAILRYRPTEDALKILTAVRMISLRMRDFVVNKNHKDGGVFFPVGQGDVDWLAVRKTLDEIGYSGWVTLDDVPYYNLSQQVQILDKFFEGDLTQKTAEEIRKFRGKSASTSSESSSGESSASGSENSESVSSDSN